LIDEKMIDAEMIKRLVLREYDTARIDPKDVSAGAVIITGESARKDNAEALIQSLAGLAGEFVVASAGPDLESVIAGKGSGAHAYSEAHKQCVINLDVGGGTTNGVLFDCGKTISTGCIDIGGRAVRADRCGRVERFTPSAREIACVYGIPLYTGMLDLAALSALSRCMAELIGQMIGLVPATELLNRIRTPHSGTLAIDRPVDAVCFSGGVADAVYDSDGAKEAFRFLDIGLLLGQAIAASDIMHTWRVIRPEETLRATVVGAGSYTISLSGSTISVRPDRLPLKNVPVLRLDQGAYQALCRQHHGDLGRRIRWMLEQSAGGLVALSAAGERDPCYASMCVLAQSIADAYAGVDPSVPIIVVLEEDMGKSLGQMIRQRTERAVVAIDGVYAGGDDYIDIGRPIAGDMAVPVVVKTLAFGAQ
jgi:ethanolamine utilization protein EutA